MGTSQHVKTGKTLLEFPVCPPSERVSEYVLQCNKKQDMDKKVTNIGGIVQMQCHSMSKGLSVIYLLTQKRNLLSGIYDEDIFGIDMKCYPLKGHEKRCMIIPIHGQQLSSLTDKCVCLECLDAAVRRAESQGKDVEQYINKRLLGRYNLVTVRAGVVAPW